MLPKIDIDLGNSLIPTAPLVLFAIAEEPVENDADNWEDEYQKRPGKLVADWTGGLDNLDCVWSLVLTQDKAESRRPTNNNDVQNKDDEANDSTACASLPLVLRDAHGWRCHGQGEQA